MVRGSEGLPPGESWLLEAERERAATMRVPKRRAEYLTRRLAGKAAVAALLELPSDEATWARIGILNDPTGAPRAILDGTPPGLEVALTDRSGWAVCLVGPAPGALGVDLELIEPRSPGFLRDFLTPREQALVHACTGAGPSGCALAANLIWSAKESALKVLRTGLRSDPRTAEVTLADPVALRTSIEDGGAAPWSQLSVVTTTAGALPGYWRREGSFLVTVVTGPGTRPARPRALAGSQDLSRATPIDDWTALPGPS